MWMKPGIIRQNAVRKIVQSAGKFYACETTASNDKGKKRRAKSGVGLQISTLEHLDDVIPDADGIEKTIKIECELLDVRHSQVVGNRAKSKDQLVVGNFSPSRCSIRTCIVTQNYQTLFEIHSLYNTSNELGTA